MKKILVVVSILAALALSSAALAAEDSASQNLVQPLPIYLPSGANIVGELNISDDNVLGMAKSVMSALLDDLQDIDIKAACPVPLPAVVSQIDIKKLVESTYGIKSIRFLEAQYHTTPQQFIKQFEIGVPKAGQFSRILMDTTNGDTAVAVYAKPGNAGYLLGVYEPYEEMIYAIRVEGFIDVKQFVDVLGDIGKAYVQVKCGAAAVYQSEEMENSSTDPAPEIQK